MRGFSWDEGKELLKAWGALSIAFAIVMRGEYGFLVTLAISAGTVGIGFILHELAHRYVAHRYNLGAEFKANNLMLVFALLTSLLGFILAAPGGVHILGAVSRDKHGKIALAGPLANIALAVVFLALHFATTGTVSNVLLYGFSINAFLALFNLLPIPGFDGGTVMAWSKGWFAAAIITAGLLTFYSFI